MKLTHHQGNISVEFIGQIHNLGELRSRLDLDGDLGTLEVLIAGWLRWKEKLAENLIGDFSLAIIDRTNHITYFARDPFGIKPLYYRINGSEIHYDFSVPELKRRCPLNYTKDMDWAAAYMLSLSFNKTTTAYKEILKLAPGHWLTFTDAGILTTEQYHFWHDNTNFETSRNKHWVDSYRNMLEESIRCRMDPNAPMASENSGGIDSAAITSYLAKFLGEPGDRLYSLGFALGELEPSYILETSRAHHIRHNYIITDDCGMKVNESHIAKATSILGYPDEQGSATINIPFLIECQKNGIHTLFSGFGGDEVVSNPGYLLYKELHDRRHYLTLWPILQGNPLLKSLRIIKAIATKNNESKYNHLHYEINNNLWSHKLLKPEVAERLNLYERYMESSRYDAPYRRINDFILNHHLSSLIITSRLETSAAIAAAYGVEYQWPLLDVRLVQQYLSTPSIEKYGPNNTGRYLHRRAIDGIVPKRITWNPSKDMGYTNATNELRQTGIISIAESAKKLEQNIHPSIAEIIDLEKLHRQITQALNGNAEKTFTISFIRNVNALYALDFWLKET